MVFPVVWASLLGFAQLGVSSRDLHADAYLENNSHSLDAREPVISDLVTDLVTDSASDPVPDSVSDLVTDSTSDSTSDSASDSTSEVTPGVLHFALTKPSLWERAALMRRDEYSALSMSNHVTMFSAQLALGSNQQTVNVLVDTGSSDLWVMAKSNPYCSGTTSTSADGKNRINDVVKRASSSSSSQISCYQSTQFEASSSSTFSLNSTAFQITYGDGSFANGSYAQDSVTFGGHTISNANFAFANQSDSQISVWGIGLRGLEATVKTYDQKGNFSPTYSNLPVQMKEQGIIKQNAYSMWLNDLDASEGSLLFGGIDHARYNGTLQTLPMLSSYSNTKPNEMKIKLSKISLYQNDNSIDVVQCAYPALLDSGTSFMMIPANFLNAILKSIGGVYTTSGVCYATCGLSGGLKFDFSGVQIDVPFSEILIPASSSGSICQIGLLPSSTLVLGDTFLRSAYVVYDLDNYEISLAQAVLNVTSSQVEAITSGVPSATQASGYSSTSVNTADYTTSVATFVTGTKNIASRLTTSNLGGSSAQSGGSGQTSTAVGGGTIFGTYVLTSKSSKSNHAPSVDPAANWLTSVFSGLVGLLLYL